MHTQDWLASSTMLIVTHFYTIQPVKKKTDHVFRVLSFTLFSGWWFQPLWKILVSWDDYSQYMEKIENVPNHQPVFNVTKIIQWGLSNNGVSQIPCFFVIVIPFPFTCNLEVYSTGIARLYTQFSVTPIHIFGLVISYKAGGHNLFSQKN